MTYKSFIWQIFQNNMSEKTPSKWSSPGSTPYIRNVPTILPPGLDSVTLQSILLRSQFEEVQYKLANLKTEAHKIVQFDEILSKKNTLVYDQNGYRKDPTPVRARDALFQERKEIISAIDKIYPIFRVPGSIRISYKKSTRKFYLPSPNCIGLILGPRGESLKALESKYKVKISIRGQGSTPDARTSGEVFTPRSPDEPLHALIEADTDDSINACIQELEYIIMPKPDQENELKKKQLYQLAVYNGVVSAESAFEKTEESDFPPWYDPSLKIENNDVKNAVDSLVNDLDSKEENKEEDEQAKKLEKYKPFMINLREVDISVILPERLPPGLE